MVYKSDKNHRYFWNATSFKQYAKTKYNKSYELTLGEILARICEEEKNKFPDKKDSHRRLLQLHKGYESYKSRCYSSIDITGIVPRDNADKIDNFKKELRTNEFTADKA
jgi:hypothetical protein